MKNETVNTESGFRKGRGHYSHAKADKAKAQRRDEAFERQLEHESLSTSEQIQKAKSRRGESKKEIARLKARLAKEVENAKGEKKVLTPKKAVVK